MVTSQRTWLALLTCFAALTAHTLLAQDDQSAPPPPPSDQSAPPPDEDSSQDSASFQTFYDNLSSQGTWVQTSDYGYVWQPQETDPGWAPYTEGHWVYTADGWTWVSDEPWGWATYHYGRWVNLDGTGWCWVPGYTWAPAWVSWRYGDGYCGWAPLPPDSFAGIEYFGDGVTVGIDFHIGGDCDSYYGIGAGWYHFLPVSYLGHRSYHGHYYNRHDNFAIINHTTNVTNLNVTRGQQGGFDRHVTTGGPALSQVNAVAQVPVAQVNLVRSAQPGGGSVTNNSLALYRPHLSPGNPAAFKPTNVTGTLGHATINRGTDITRPLVVSPGLTTAPPTPEQIQAARLAQENAPAHAKVATVNTPVRALLPAPLPSMKPYSPPTVAPQQTAVPLYTQQVPSSPISAPTHNYPVNNPGGQSSSRVYEPAPSHQQPAYQAPVVFPHNDEPQPSSAAPQIHYPAQPAPQYYTPPSGSGNNRSYPGGGSYRPSSSATPQSSGGQQKQQQSQSQQQNQQRSH